MAQNVTAFVLDEDRVAVAVDGATLPGIPGMWRPGEAIHPDALGLTVTEMRDLIVELGLPLKEVKVPADKAYTAFVRPDDANHLPSEALSLRGGPVAVEDSGFDEVQGDPTVIDSTLDVVERVTTEEDE